MKIVYGDVYFSTEAVEHIPPELLVVYNKALKRLVIDFKHNVVKISKDLTKVTLLWYPHLHTHSHPYLENSALIPIDENLKIKYRKESKTNPVILHRIETLLSHSNNRLPLLRNITLKEEELGLYDKEHIHHIGRRTYWNMLCIEKNLHDSCSPELNIQKIKIKRENTAISSKNMSAPTRWALENRFVEGVVFDWGCGKERDSIGLRKLGFNVISYDPFYKKEPHPQNVDFSNIKTVLLNYVLNIIEEPNEREATLNYIKQLSKANTKVIVSVRSTEEIQKKAEASKWKKYNDGYITKHNTFQKGFNLEEVIDLCSKYGEVIHSTMLSGGCVCVLSVTK